MRAVATRAPSSDSEEEEEESEEQFSTSGNSLDVPGELWIHHLDVDQGEAAIIVYLVGDAVSFAALVDGGLSTMGGGHVARHLDNLGVKRLNAVIVTHYDADHLKGVTRFLEFNAAREGDGKIAIECVYERDADSRDLNETSILEFRDVCNRSNLRRARLHGRSPPLQSEGGAVTIECVHSDDGPKTPGEEENNASIALLIKYHGFRYYLGGDLESGIEDRLTKPDGTGRLGGHLCGFKCGHHGARACSSAKFITNMKPRIAVISCGRHSYDHPDDEVVERLCDAPSIEHFYLTNCHGNRAGVNPDFLSHEKHALEKLLEQVEAVAEGLTREIVEAALDDSRLDTLRAEVVRCVCGGREEGGEPGAIRRAQSVLSGCIRAIEARELGSVAKSNEQLEEDNDKTKQHQETIQQLIEAKAGRTRALQAFLDGLGKFCGLARTIHRRVGTAMLELQGKGRALKGVVGGDDGAEFMGTIIVCISGHSASNPTNHTFHVSRHGDASTGWVSQSYSCNGNGGPARGAGADTSPGLLRRLHPSWVTIQRLADQLNEGDQRQFKAHVEKAGKTKWQTGQRFAFVPSGGKASSEHSSSTPVQFREDRALERDLIKSEAEEDAWEQLKKRNSRRRQARRGPCVFCRGPVGDGAGAAVKCPCGTEQWVCGSDKCLKKLERQASRCPICRKPYRAVGDTSAEEEKKMRGKRKWDGGEKGKGEKPSASKRSKREEEGGDAGGEKEAGK